MYQLHHKIIGSGPPLVFLHGLFGMLDNWYGFAKGLSDQYTCILIDQRNHGRSFHSEDMNYRLMAEDVQRLLDDNWIHETAVLGHSMGGKTAMQLALDFPDLVTHLIVVDIAPARYLPSHQREFTAMEQLNPSMYKTRSDLRDALLVDLDAVTTDFLLKNIARDETGFSWRLGLEGLQKNYEDLIQAPTLLHDPYAGPGLFVKGGKSHYIQESHVNAINDLFTDARVVEIAKANHWVHVDAAPELAGLVSSFLKD